MSKNRLRLVHRDPRPTTPDATNVLRAGKQAEAHMKTGGLVPDPLILNLILSELTSRKWLETPHTNENVIAALERGNGSASRVVHASNSPDTSFILDGFPRTATQ